MPHKRPNAWLLSLIVVVVLSLIVPHGRFWLSAVVLLFAPGYLIECWLNLPCYPLARPAIWISLSFSSLILAYLWVTTAGLSVSLPLIWLVLLALIIGVGWRWYKYPPRLQFTAIAPLPLLLVFGLLILFTVYTRIQHISGLVFPPWVDSVHHATMIRVIAEQGKVPYSLRPYLPVDNFIYHWGYHAVTATVWQVSDLSLPTAMLWFGQYLGVLQVLSLAGVVAGITKRLVAGIVAGIVVAFLSVMPAYFVSWGRYTLLTGGMILPALLYAGWQASELINQRGLALLTLLIAGLLPTHFVVAGIGLLWLGAVWLIHGLAQTQRWRILGLFALAFMLAIIFVSPWLAVVITQVGPQAVGPKKIEGGSYNTYQAAIGLYWTSDNRAIMALSLIGLIVLLVRRWRIGLVVLVWSILIAFVANPVWLGLSYLSFFNNNIVALMLYLLFSFAIGAGVAALDEGITGWLNRSPRLLRDWRIARTAVLGLFIIWQGFANTAIINQGTILAKPSDLPALNWIENNTAPTARFALNTQGWLNNVSQGSDGGWWILPYTGRQMSTPPVIYTYGTPEYAQWVQAQTNWLRDAKNLTPDDIATWMRANGYEYAYATKDGKLFNSAQLAASPSFEAVYQSPDVTIVRVR